jgi:hypothetical protein
LAGYASIIVSQNEKHNNDLADYKRIISSQMLLKGKDLAGYENFIHSQIFFLTKKQESKKSRSKGLGFGLPLEGVRHDSALLCILMECWPPARRSYGSERVMEYWKNQNPTPIFCNLKQRPSRFSDA